MKIGERQIDELLNQIQSSSDPLFQSKNEFIMHVFSGNGSCAYFMLMERSEKLHITPPLRERIRCVAYDSVPFCLDLDSFAGALTATILITLGVRPRGYVPILTTLIWALLFLLYPRSVTTNYERQLSQQLPVPQLVLYSDEDIISLSKFVPDYVEKQKKLGRDVTVV